MARRCQVCIPWAILAALAASVAPGPLRAQFWATPEARQTAAQTALQTVLPGFDDEAYGPAVEAMLAAYEREHGVRLSPGRHGRAALRVYTNSGLGLATPQPLVRAVLRSLERRGFAPANLLVVDTSELRLRDAQFLPPLSRVEDGPRFAGVPVRALESGALFHPDWFYENPLPPPLNRPVDRFADDGRPQTLGTPDAPSPDRRSLLPATLILDVDFWINLPVGLDHPALGISGALANASLWSVSNRERFFVSPNNAPIAAAEIAAVPEYADNAAVTLLSLERYQFIGGPVFNSLYTRSEALLLASANPVALDGILLERFNAARREVGFQPLDPDLALLRFAESVGLGPRAPEALTWRTVRP